MIKRRAGKKLPLLIKAPRGSLKAPSTSRLPVIVDAVPYPSNARFDPPLKPAQVFQNYPNYLTRSESSEITKYNTVYFIRLDPPPKDMKAPRRMGNFFTFVKNDHLSYRYQQLEVLGKGSFGSVLKCLDHKTGNLVAVKMLRDQKKVHGEILFEVDLLKRLQSENETHIIKYVESFAFRGFFCIAMELVHDDLYTSLQRVKFSGFRMQTVKMVVKQTSEALHFIHQSGIMHCDIKPENILFVSPEQKNVKLIDFGCSCFIGKILFSYIQSRYYRAPEVVLGMQYGKPIDVWSLGCVICEIITGRALFPAESEDELIEMIIEMIGNPPPQMTMYAPRANRYFETNGTLKPRAKGKGDRKVRVPNGTTIEKKTGIKDRALLTILEGCFKWTPSDRLSAEQIMNDPWCCVCEEERVPHSARV